MTPEALAELVALSAERREPVPGAAYRRRRIAAKITVGELAAALGVEYKTLWNWEMSRHRPTKRNMTAWTAALDALESDTAKAEELTS